MQTTPQGRAELTFLEGKENYAYQDSVQVWTIGVGHTAAAGDPKPVHGMYLSDAQVDNLLARDLANIYEPAVERHVVVPLTPNQFDAVVLWTFSLGEANLKASTLLRKLNHKDYEGAYAEFPKWDKARGKVLAGLTTRRAIEAKIFKFGVYTNISETLPVPPTLVPLLRSGSQGKDVILLQKDLAHLLFYKGRVDGSFGPKTKAAVQAFQRSAGLSDDGVVGLKTHVALDRLAGVVV